MPLLDAQSLRMWTMILIVVVIIVAGFQIFRVNRESPVDQVVPVDKYTRGKVVDELLNIGAGSFVNFRINLNRRGRLFGTFAVRGVNASVRILVVDRQNFDSWQRGAEFNFISATGVLPGGKVDRTLEPGEYYLVFDNRNSTADRIVDADFKVE
jgi:hypothetical protein